MIDPIDVKQEDLAEALYNMKLGDIVWCEQHYGCRVPGGWLWTLLTSSDDQTSQASFVPFNDEFKAKPRPGAGGMIPGI